MYSTQHKQLFNSLAGSNSYSQALEAVVIGAGVIGLAIARALSQRGKEVLVIERHPAIGTESSSRNSEVIHAGLYYTPGSLKSRMCVEGKHMLYNYCQEKQIPHQKLGKLLVANTEEEIDKLKQIKLNAQKNGVNDLQILTSEDAKQMEQDVKCEGGLFSPSTGIVDSHSLMLALQIHRETLRMPMVPQCQIKNLSLDLQTATTEQKEF
eukprot:TRINITY_DN8714_c0_g1_i1.p1 TRINITY_DN8714_c0_g1~~TRINITY_DN8714_c0_g1_i1.p1  ORF type:complete len:216 (-),score=9.83 TRINITY_DN8714_c0_g1_i1:466-1092(-)